MSPRRGAPAPRLSIALSGAALWLSGCATLPPQTTPPLMAWPARRTALLLVVQHFTLNGRLAASNGQEGFSAGISWQQRGSRASLQLTGPLGFGTAKLVEDGEELRITTGNGMTLRGAAAEAELTKMLGFEPPLESLHYWVLGVSDPAMSAEQSLDAQQRLLQLQQEGWLIKYDEYTPVHQQWLPRRLTLTRANLRLKLVINAWQL